MYASATQLHDLRTRIRRLQDHNSSSSIVEWEPWLNRFFPDRVSCGFADHHRAIWDWGWSIEKDKSSSPLVVVVPRGGGKTTTLEMLAASLFARKSRTFLLYVCGIQLAANSRLQGIESLITSPKFASAYPDLADRAVNVHGNPTGWRQSFIKTAAGCVIVPVGLDTAATRGLNIEGKRPDLIFFDDIDGLHDTEEISKKKEDTITKTILPACGSVSSVAFVQNLIIPHGVASRLSDGRANFLIHRKVIGPVPAIRNLKTKENRLESGLIQDLIVDGEATWQGQDLETCQDIIDDIGLSSFLREQQHEVKDVSGSMIKSGDIQHVADVPRLDNLDPAIVRVSVGVDPPGGRTECGIVAVADAGKDKFPRYYVWGDYTCKASDGPDVWGQQTVQLAVERGAAVYAEGNYGGNMTTFIVQQAAEAAREVLAIHRVSAKMDKAGRALPVVQSIQRGETVFVGYHAELESQLTTWVPKASSSKSPNRIDALAHAYNSVAVGRKIEPIDWGSV